MLNIAERSNEELITLKHGINVFHDALARVREGETRFHVTDESGRVPDYDLVYTANMLLFPEQVRALILKMTQGGALYMPFLTYDEEDTDNMCLDFLKQFTKIELENVDEYSVAVARTALRYTDVPVYYADERLEWFLEETPQLNKTGELPEEPDKTVLRINSGPFDMGYTVRDWSKLGSVAAFQNVFFWQAFTSGKKGGAKYLEVILSQISGIGAILSIMSMTSNVAAVRGLSAYLQPGCTRYPEELLCRYFRLNPKPADATPDNTIVITDLAALSTTWLCCQYPANFDESILEDGFAGEMSEYAEAVLGNKKTLGVLARGTDYVTNNLGDDRIHARPAHMIPEIKKWMQEKGYEKIFLATEDKDIYDAFLKEFPGKITVIAQERHTVSELKEKDTSLIFEFEKKLNKGKAYKDALEDTTVNYFYALYILSKCDAFMCSGQCNGWDVVRSFNKGKFEKEYKFTVGIDNAKSGRNIGGAILSGKFFMYTDSSFHAIAVRFVFKDDIDPDKLQKAADDALMVHPWAAYGIYEEDGSFYCQKATSRTIKIREGDYEGMPALGGEGTEGIITNIFFKGKEVTVATFHGLTDGRGLMMFADEMLKAYASYSDSGSYIPELKENPDVNAEPFEAAKEEFEKMKLPEMPAKKGGGFMDKTPFLIQKGFEAGDIKPCHYFIKADAAGYMKAAKTLGVRPAAFLAASYAKAVVKVMGEPGREMKIAIPVDFREALGIPNTFRNCAMPPVITAIPPETLKSDIKDVALKLQAALEQRTTKEAGVTAVKMMADMMEKFPRLPYKEAAGLFANFSNGPLFTFNVSYVQRITENEYSSLLEGAYFLYPSEGSQTVLMMMALPGSFCITVNQGGETEVYAEALCEVLKENGVSCEAGEVLRGNTGYIEIREYEKWA